MKLLAIICFGLLVIACAKPQEATTESGAPVDDVMATFKRGDLRLDCVDDRCRDAYQRSAGLIANYFHQGQYDQAINAIATSGYSLDLSYYLFAVIAFRQGFVAPAHEYLELAKTSEYQCADAIGNCFDIDLVTAMAKLQENIQFATESSQFKSDRPGSSNLAKQPSEDYNEDNESESVQFDLEKSERYAGMVFTRDSSPEFNYDPYRRSGWLNGTYVFFTDEAATSKYFYVLMSVVEADEPIRHQLFMMIDHLEALTGVYKITAQEGKELALKHNGTTEKCEPTCLFRDSIGIPIGAVSLQSYARTGLEFSLKNGTSFHIPVFIPAAYFLDYLHLLTNYDLQQSP